MTGDTAVADDLAQETLLEAWRSQQALLDEWLADSDDIELALERKELAALLDRALALLPAETRDALLAHYLIISSSRWTIFGS